MLEEPELQNEDVSLTVPLEAVNSGVRRSHCGHPRRGDVARESDAQAQRRGRLLGSLLVCVATALAGCANKTTPTTPQPVNGQCDVVQDMCILGTPSDTGDTTPPYGWMCLGRFGGTNDTCSVSTARVERDEIFAGQNALEEKVKAAGSLTGKMVVFDPTTDSDSSDFSSHADWMKKRILDMGVPEENLVFTADHFGDFFTKDTWRETLEGTLVVGHPTTWAMEFRRHGSLSYVTQFNILHVAAAGNASTFGNRDLWYPEHPHWEDRPGGYETALRLFATGKVILAKTATIDSQGNVVPWEKTVRCGNAKDVCFSVLLPADGEGYTSSASVRLGALAFYLSQLWSTPQEVIGVLNVCAEDVGEPGIDEEFGRGVASVVCDTVRNREVGLVTRSTVVSNASPVLNQMTGLSPITLLPQSFVSRPLMVPTQIRFFHAIEGHNLETITGHLGSQFSLQGTDLFVSGGADRTPLGIRSSLLRATRVPFMEFGSKRTLFSYGGHRVSLLGTYGYSNGGSMAAHVGHLGVRYETPFASGVLSLNAGYRQTQGRIGIPGYREAGASPTPFRSDAPEVRLSFVLRR